VHPARRPGLHAGSGGGFTATRMRKQSGSTAQHVRSHSHVRGHTHKHGHTLTWGHTHTCGHTLTLGHTHTWHLPLTSDQLRVTDGRCSTEPWAVCKHARLCGSRLRLCVAGSPSTIRRSVQTMKGGQQVTCIRQARPEAFASAPESKCQSASRRRSKELRSCWQEEPAYTVGTSE
jgi:hypothetical protein